MICGGISTYTASVSHVTVSMICGGISTYTASVSHVTVSMICGVYLLIQPLFLMSL